MELESINISEDDIRYSVRTQLRWTHFVFYKND